MRAAKVGLAVLLVLVMLSSVVSPAMAAASDTVSQKEVRTVAEKFIKKISTTDIFKDWRSARIGRIIPAYDVNENITAYIIELVKDGSYAGYVVVSAKKTNYPILEFSKGKSPLMRAKELGIKAEKIYRIGGLEYFVGSEGKYYDLNKREIDFNKIKGEIKKAMKDVRIKNHLIKRAKEAKAQWEKYNSGITTSSWYGVHIQGVPALLWERGCTPTAAAMVLGYWDQHGYPNFPNDYQHTLIDELADAMGTWSNGYTPQWQVSGGINKVTNRYGYGDWASDVWWVTWNMVTEEISAQRPFILTMVLQPTYIWHSVTVVGYAVDIDTNEKFILLHNTWDTEVHYIAFGSWFGANAHKVVPT